MHIIPVPGDSTRMIRVILKCLICVCFNRHIQSFYAAKSSLLFGGDCKTSNFQYTKYSSNKFSVAYVFTSSNAAIPIKTYSPELIVIPVYNDLQLETLQPTKIDATVVVSPADSQKFIDNMVSTVDSYLSRLHTIVVGPGLGRDPLVMAATIQIIQHILTTTQLA